MNSCTLKDSLISIVGLYFTNRVPDMVGSILVPALFKHLNITALTIFNVVGLLKDSLHPLLKDILSFLIFKSRQLSWHCCTQRIQVNVSFGRYVCLKLFAHILCSLDVFLVCDGTVCAFFCCLALENS